MTNAQIIKSSRLDDLFTGVWCRNRDFVNRRRLTSNLLNGEGVGQTARAQGKVEQSSPVKTRKLGENRLC